MSLAALFWLAGCHDDSSCPEMPVAGVSSFAGTWQITATPVAPLVESGCPDLGLDSALLEMELLFAGIVDADCDPATADRIHIGRYDVSSANLDTDSVAEPGASRLIAQAVTEGPGAELLFLLGGFYYFPPVDITVELEPDPSSAIVTDTSFSLKLGYAVFAGEPIVAADPNIPEEDDDCDGEVDEPDEHELVDEIDSSAVPLCSGSILLQGTRPVAQAPQETLGLFLDPRGFPPRPVVFFRRSPRE